MLGEIFYYSPLFSRQSCQLDSILICDVLLRNFSKSIIFLLVIQREKFKVDFAVVTSKHIDMLFPHTKKSLLNCSDAAK